MKSWGLLRFCDVSKWQSVMDWTRTAQVLDFAYAKCSQGPWEDPQWHANYQGAKAAGIPLGMYHYYDNTVSRQANTDKFIAMIDQYPTGLLPALDLEKQTRAPIMAHVLGCIGDIAEHIGALPIIYTGPDYILTYLSRYQVLSRYPLWISHYSTDKRWPLAAPRVPLPWFPMDYWAWQFSADGNGQGRYYGASSNAIDLNVAWELPRL